MKPLFTSLFRVALVLLTLLFASCSQPAWMAASWPEADKLFQGDPHWVGGDGGYSIDLGNGRVLWLFADSWVDPRGAGVRTNAVMVSNTLAIQRGYDPSKAAIKFFRGGDPSRPEAFFTGSNGERYWPGSGVRVGDRLLLFLMQVHDIEEGLGFMLRNWSAVLVENPQQDPDQWKIQWLECPQNGLNVIVGSGTAFVLDGHVYAFSAQEPDSKHDVYLVRWLQEDVWGGSLRQMEWWSGSALGWSRECLGPKSAEPVMTAGQTEFTVHHDRDKGHWVQTQTEGFGKAVIVQRTAVRMTGPWSDKAEVFAPPENKFARIIIYQGKAHPHLTGGDLILTYSTNSSDFADHFKEPWLYYPRFVRMNKTTAKNRYRPFGIRRNISRQRPAKWRGAVAQPHRD